MGRHYSFCCAMNAYLNITCFNLCTSSSGDVWFKTMEGSTCVMLNFVYCCCLFVSFFLFVKRIRVCFLLLIPTKGFFFVCLCISGVPCIVVWFCCLGFRFGTYFYIHLDVLRRG